MNGIAPIDFYEMTCKDIGAFCLCKRKKEKEDAMVEASILYRIAEKIASETNMSKPKKVKFNKLFPEFDEKAQLKNDFNNMSEENKNVLIAETWRKFLGK